MYLVTKTGMTTNGKHTFIIIDDHPLIRDGIKSCVAALDDFEFMGEFKDTRTVLNSTFNGIPKIIILDLSLPGMDGERSMPLLRKKFPQCRIVAFTQHEGKEKELKKIGFDGYAVKNERESLTEALLAVARGEQYFKSNHKIPLIVPAGAAPTDAYTKMKQLTRRETEVGRYIIQDFSNKEIADKIGVSESTVETHRKHIKEKLGLNSKRELYAMLRTYYFPES